MKNFTNPNRNSFFQHSVDQKNKDLFPHIVCVDPVLSKKHVCALTNIGKSKLSELIRKNQFPKPIILGPRGSRGIGWRASTINKWLDEREEVEVAQ